MTSWQDIVVLVGGFGFAIALIKSVVKGVKMPLSTPLVTSVILVGYIVVYASYSLWWGVMSQCIVLAMWGYLLYIAIRRRHDGS